MPHATLAAGAESRHLFRIAPEPVPELDPVGAGDALNAAYFAARISGRPVATALAEGARCGAAVAATLGDVMGFPRPRDTGARHRP